MVDARPPGGSSLAAAKGPEAFDLRAFMFGGDYLLSLA
jgi:hypothetical protein